MIKKIAYVMLLRKDNTEGNSCWLFKVGCNHIIPKFMILIIVQMFCWF